MPGGPVAGEERAPLAGVLEGLELPAGGVALLYGRRGVGKTTIGLRALARPWVSSSEMAPGLVRAYAARLEARIARVSVARRLEVPDGAGATVDLGTGADYSGDLLLDSLTATGDDVGALRAARAFAELGNRVIATAQVTKAGDVRGPATLEHDCDLVIELEAEADTGIARVTKNRFGPLTTIVYTLGEAGATRPEWDRYYSIEGRAPDYRLEPWPSRGARFAELLRRAEAGELGEGLELPAPPVAVCCEFSRLYVKTGGWIDPPDLERRVAFARDNGLPFFSPVKGLIE